MGYDQKALEKLFGKKQEAISTESEQIGELTSEPKTVPESKSVEMMLPVPADTSKRVVEVPISELNDYPKQLFKPYTEEKLKKLEASIREHGVIFPLIVRIVDGEYQTVCGHNRKRAAAQASFETVPCIVEDLSDDEADIKMVETNLQTRDGLLPSEKAFAYKLKLEAKKHQGIACGHYVPRSRDQLSDNKSGRQIQRYIRLTNLIVSLLDLVDNKTLQLVPAVELSYLSVPDQETVYNYFYVEHKLFIDEPLAKRLREQSQIDRLTDESIMQMIQPAKTKLFTQVSRFNIPQKPLNKVLKKIYNNVPAKDIENEMLTVLLEYYEKKLREMERGSVEQQPFREHC